jgi:hypothetical protein
MKTFEHQREGKASLAFLSTNRNITAFTATLLASGSVTKALT